MMRVRLRPHTVLNTNDTFNLKLTRSNTNVRSVHPGRANTTQYNSHCIHSTNEDQRRPVIAIVHSVYEGEITTSYTASITNNTTQFKRIQSTTNKRTYCSPRANTTPVPCIHALNQQRSTQSSHRHYFSVFGQHNMRIKLRPHISAIEHQ